MTSQPTPPADAHSRISNPFSTRFVRPGAIPFFWSERTAGSLVEKLRQANWWGEIVGPHGSGKSTLLAGLIRELEEFGQRPLVIELHDGQRRLGINLSAVVGEQRPTITVVDGYEQLSWWSKYRLKRFCRSHKLGLLITSHRSQGFPAIYHTRPTRELARQLVDYLLHDQRNWVSDDELQSLFASHGGNLRELLFALYDRFEARRTATRES